MNMPVELGGTGMTTFQQVLVSEQLGRVTNAWDGACTRRRVGSAVVSEHQMDTWIKPTIRGEMHECYAITEEGAGSDVDAIEATARRDGDDYVLNGVEDARDQLQPRRLLLFQAKIGAGSTRVSTRCSSSTSTRRRAGRAHARLHAHVRRPPSARRVRGRPRARANLVGDEGDGMAFTYEWFRYERLMIAARCCGAADRLITRPPRSRRSACSSASRSSSSRRSSTCWPTRSPNCGRRAS
jgi:hypothetical protein